MEPGVAAAAAVLGDVTGGIPAERLPRPHMMPLVTRGSLVMPTLLVRLLAAGFAWFGYVHNADQGVEMLQLQRAAALQRGGAAPLSSELLFGAMVHAWEITWGLAAAGLVSLVAVATREAWPGKGGAGPRRAPSAGVRGAVGGVRTGSDPGNRWERIR